MAKDCLTTALTKLRDIQHKQMSREVTYVNGRYQLTLDATPSSGLQFTETLRGFQSEARYLEWFVNIEDLTLHGKFFVPQAGHRIIENRGLAKHVYEAVEGVGDGVWRYADVSETAYAITMVEIPDVEYVMSQIEQTTS